MRELGVVQQFGEREREIFGDALADHFELGLGTGTPRHGGFDRPLLPLACRV